MREISWCSFERRDVLLDEAVEYSLMSLMIQGCVVLRWSGRGIYGWLESSDLDKIRSSNHSRAPITSKYTWPLRLLAYTTAAMDFLKSAVLASISKGPAFPYSFDTQVDIDQSIWTLHNGTKRVCASMAYILGILANTMAGRWFEVQCLLL